MTTATLPETFADQRATRDADAQAAYLTMIRKHAEHHDTDPGDLLGVLSAGFVVVGDNHNSTAM